MMVTSYEGRSSDFPVEPHREVRECDPRMSLEDIGKSESEVNVVNKKDTVKKPEQKPNKPTPKK